jgi:XTP/dITP diphosphohydrolase
MRLLLATLNPGKLTELRELLIFHNERLAEPLALELLDPAALGLTEPVEETGGSYSENASLKAQEYARASGLVALGDDSGLEVDALGGAPGLYSARYAGPGAGDAERRTKLLEELAGVPPERRGARFRCVIAIATPHGEVRLAKGAVEGRIAAAPAGTGGFGYDPVFYVPEIGCTLAEAAPEVKNAISHRGRAIARAMPPLRELAAGRAGG